MATRKRSGSLQGLQQAANPNMARGFQFGDFGPEDPVQGPFGHDTQMMNPQWAEWFDRVKDAGVGAFGGTSSAGGSLSSRQRYVDQHANQLWGK